MTSPTANGEGPRPTMRRHGMSRKRFHRLYPMKYMTHGGPKVAVAPAIAPGTPPTLRPMRLIIRIMFGPGITCDTAKKSANSRSVTQPLAATKLRTSGRTEGNPPKLSDDSIARCSANATDADGLFITLSRLRRVQQQC